MKTNMLVWLWKHWLMSLNILETLEDGWQKWEPVNTLGLLNDLMLFLKTEWVNFLAEVQWSWERAFEDTNTERERENKTELIWIRRWNHIQKYFEVWRLKVHFTEKDQDEAALLDELNKPRRHETNVLQQEDECVELQL